MLFHSEPGLDEVAKAVRAVPRQHRRRLRRRRDGARRSADRGARRGRTPLRHLRAHRRHGRAPLGRHRQRRRFPTGDRPPRRARAPAHRIPRMARRQSWVGSDRLHGWRERACRAPPRPRRLARRRRRSTTGPWPRSRPRTARSAASPDRVSSPPATSSPSEPNTQPNVAGRPISVVGYDDSPIATIGAGADDDPPADPGDRPADRGHRQPPRRRRRLWTDPRSGTPRIDRSRQHRSAPATTSSIHHPSDHNYRRKQ